MKGTVKETKDDKSVAQRRGPELVVDDQRVAIRRGDNDGEKNQKVLLAQERYRQSPPTTVNDGGFGKRNGGGGPELVPTSGGFPTNRKSTKRRTQTKKRTRGLEQDESDWEPNGQDEEGQKQQGAIPWQERLPTRVRRGSSRNEEEEEEETAPVSGAVETGVARPVTEETVTISLGAARTRTRTMPVAPGRNDHDDDRMMMKMKEEEEDDDLAKKPPPLDKDGNGIGSRKSAAQLVWNWLQRRSRRFWYISGAVVVLLLIAIVAALGATGGGAPSGKIAWQPTVPTVSPVPTLLPRRQSPTPIPTITKETETPTRTPITNETSTMTHSPDAAPGASNSREPPPLATPISVASGCTLCANGLTPPPLADKVLSGNTTCGHLARQIINPEEPPLVEPQSPTCLAYQNIGFLSCGCPTRPNNPCLFCPEDAKEQEQQQRKRRQRLAGRVQEDSPSPKHTPPAPPPTGIILRPSRPTVDVPTLAGGGIGLRPESSESRFGPPTPRGPTDFDLESADPELVRPGIRPSLPRATAMPVTAPTVTTTAPPTGLNECPLCGTVRDGRMPHEVATVQSQLLPNVTCGQLHDFLQQDDDDEEEALGLDDCRLLQAVGRLECSCPPPPPEATSSCWLCPNGTVSPWLDLVVQVEPEPLTCLDLHVWAVGLPLEECADFVTVAAPLCAC